MCIGMPLTRGKFEGALLGIAIGDALGMPVEGLSIEDIKRKFGRITDYLNGRMPKGSYTDDTEMTLAVTEAILEKGLDINYIAKKLAEKHNFERGYGPGTLYILRAIRRGRNWVEISPKLFGSGSYGNGCIVRSTPIILLLHTYKDALNKYLVGICKITHYHKYAIEAVKIFSEIMNLTIENKTDTKEYLEVIKNTVATKIYKEKIKSIQNLLTREPKDEEVINTLGNGPEAYNTIPISIYTFLKNINSFEKAVLNAVNLGGDADSIGAIVGAWSGTLHESGKIPEKWIYNLENYEQIIKLANELYTLRKYIERIYEKIMTKIKKTQTKTKTTYIT